MRGIIISSVLCLFSAAALAAALPEWNPNKYAAPGGGKPFVPTKNLKVEYGSYSGFPEMPERLINNRMKLGLVDLIDASLEVNPQTRQAWDSARSSAAVWAESRSSYYPQINNVTTGVGGRTLPQFNQKAYLDNNLGLSWLLYDFGKRKNTAQAFMQALIGANLQYNQAVLTTIRNVAKAYYLLIGTRALVDADEKNLDEARVSLKAAEVKREAGVGTIADVLQARANEAEALYTLEYDKGQVDVAKGNLATAVGWPANINYDIEGSLMGISVEKLKESIDDLIDTALKNRPDLSAAFAKVKQRESELKSAQALHAPVLSGTANYDYFKQTNYNVSSYYGGANLSIPIFTGFNITNKVREARANLSSARDALQISKEQVIKETWNAHYDFVTSLRTIEAAQALLDSASQSYDVSFGRYKEGAADIVELMTVQSQLFKARAQYINAKTGVHMNYTELIYAVGTGFDNPLVVEDKH